jgi:Asp-tRNA(Asn)/Glu-tRNA(Gln) amidotransferase A subunit family amidase
LGVAGWVVPTGNGLGGAGTKEGAKLMIWVIVAIVLIAIAVAAFVAWRNDRSRKLKQGFGPEYERAIEEHGDQRAAEAELAERRKRREELEIRRLDPESRDRYSGRWQATQRQFVDKPASAVAEADELVMQVMHDRGYPVEDFEQRAADVSVDHPDVVQNYRAAHAISIAANDQRASTEDLRQAMVHYRALFRDLLAGAEVPRDESIPVTKGRT